MSLVAPSIVCGEQHVTTVTLTGAGCSTLPPASINVLGAGFLKLPGAEPTVTLDGVATALLALAGCVPVPDTIPGAEVCTSLTIELPGGGITAGDHLVTVLNPTASGCSGAGSAVLEVVPMPAVTPLRVCGLEGDSFVIDGADFRSDALVTVTPVGGGVAESPDLLNWNAGIALARYLHATASESGFIFISAGRPAPRRHWPRRSGPPSNA